MNEIKIKCPTCGKVLRLQDVPNINAASFTCPVCKEKHIVGKCQRFVDPPKNCTSSGDETQYGLTPSLPGVGGIDVTCIGPAPSDKIGSLVDNMGRTYQLCIGINTIGRKASTSTASVQIITGDLTMSRRHAIIEVRTDGQTIHILRNGANKNPSYLNGTIIGPRDQFMLNNGDCIRMGNTELIFKK